MQTSKGKKVSLPKAPGTISYQKSSELETLGAKPNAFTRCAVIAICFVLVIAVISLGQAFQLPEPPLPVDPRPLTELISAAEKAMLAETNPKKLVEAYVKISETHLQAALSAIKRNDHRAAERELDIYNKAVAEAGKQTFALRDGKRGVSKKLEQTLYKQIKTLETIDRLFPAEREAFADAALKHSKLMRVQALNEAFAAGDVLKEPGEEKKPESEPPKKETPRKISSVPPPLAGRIVAAPGAGSPQRNSLFTGDVSVRTFDSRRSNISATGTGSRGSGRQLPGDYLTDEEDQHVREAQAADERVKVFMMIADRRVKALAGQPSAPADKKAQKKAEEEEREWGAIPKVSRLELLRHYARAIAECIAKLEDAYERNPKSSAFQKALTMLRDSTEKQLQALRTLQPDVKNENEEAALREAISEAETANKGARDGLK
jgi:hypothetical protein